MSAAFHWSSAFHRSSASASARALFGSLVAAFVFLGCPLGPFSGGSLRGAVYEGDDVDDWTFVGDVETCQLETNPSEPHSVNTWCIGSGPYLYIPTSMILGPVDPSEREWVQNVQSDGEVRVRIAGTVYELDPDDRDPEREIWLFRMQPR